MGVAGLVLALVFVLPLWRITLDAPQYPEGLGIVIDVDELRGASEGNLESINGLNHYIGMRAIDPDAIPELKIIPWIMGGLVVLGLAAAALGRRWMVWTWLGAFALTMIGSLVRFYQWGYDYGHNLDMENAIIKVPGMVYQPPVIGTKQMLNITASSWPDVGGVAAMVAFLLGVAALVVDARSRRRASVAPEASVVVVPAAPGVG